MVIERFRDRDPLPIYRRPSDSGRMVPQALTYLDSWVEPDFDRFFQLMECDDLRLPAMGPELARFGRDN
jgi:hypothetical protein